MPDEFKLRNMKFSRYKLKDPKAIAWKDSLQADEDREIFRILDGIIEAAYDWCVLIEEEVDA